MVEFNVIGMINNVNQNNCLIVLWIENMLQIVT